MIEEIIEYLPSDYSTLSGRQIKEKFELSDEEWKSLKPELKATNKVYFGRGRGGTVRLISDEENVIVVTQSKTKKRKPRKNKLIQLQEELERRQKEYNCSCKVDANFTTKQIIELEEGCKRGTSNNPGWVCPVLVWIRKEKEKMG